MSIKKITAPVSRFLNHNTGWLIALFIVGFSLLLMTSQGKNRAIINDIQATAKNSEKIMRGQEDIIREFKEDNEKQTLIMCRIFLRSDLGMELTPEEEKEVETICQEEINRQQSTQASADDSFVYTPPPPESERQPDSFLVGEGGSPAVPGQETSEPEPTGLAGIVDDISDTTRAILNFVGGN